MLLLFPYNVSNLTKCVSHLEKIKLNWIRIKYCLNKMIKPINVTLWVIIPRIFYQYSSSITSNLSWEAIILPFQKKKLIIKSISFNHCLNDAPRLTAVMTKAPGIVAQNFSQILLYFLSSSSLLNSTYFWFFFRLYWNIYNLL